MRPLLALVALVMLVVAGNATCGKSTPQDAFHPSCPQIEGCQYLACCEKYGTAYCHIPCQMDAGVTPRDTSD